ncbi:MAG: histidinol-phosphate aminotransferase family protein, partial [Bacteroidota bacterium]
NKMAQDRDLYFDELNQLPEFKVFRSDANFVLVKMPKELMQPLNDFLKERGVIIKFMNEEILNSHMRITLGTQAQNRIAIDSIKEFMTNRDS